MQHICCENVTFETKKLQQKQLKSSDFQWQISEEHFTFIFYNSKEGHCLNKNIVDIQHNESSQWNHLLKLVSQVAE